MLLLVPLLMSYVIKIYAIRSILGGNGFLNRTLLALGIIDAAARRSSSSTSMPCC